MGLINFGIPKDFVLFLKKMYKIENFIETGTYKGETAKWAAQTFNNVVTIENSEEIYDEINETLSTYKNVSHLYGDSSLLLKEQIQLCEGPVILWLDAHWCGSNTFGIDDQCPILKELDSLTIYPKKDLFILIDDARLFLTVPPRPHSSSDYPSLILIMNELQKFESHIFVFNDVIYSLPGFTKSEVNNFIQDFYEKQSIVKEDSFFKKTLLKISNKLC